MYECVHEWEAATCTLKGVECSVSAIWIELAQFLVLTNIWEKYLAGSQINVASVNELNWNSKSVKPKQQA